MTTLNKHKQYDKVAFSNLYELRVSVIVHNARKCTQKNPSDLFCITYEVINHALPFVMNGIFLTRIIVSYYYYYY